MTSRIARVAMLVAALGGLAAAAYVVFDAEQALRSHQAARAGFAGEAQSIMGDLGRLNAAEQAYVAEGQAADHWMAQSADALAKVDKGLAALAGDATGDATRSAIQAASSVLEEFRRQDQRARQYLKTNQPLMASDVVFTDSLNAGTAVGEHVVTAQANEAAVQEAAIDELHWRELYACGGAALLLTLAVLLLAPIPERDVDVLTAMRALTEAPPLPQAKRAEPAVAAPAVAVAPLPLPAPDDDDIPDVEAVVAVTGRLPTFAAESNAVDEPARYTTPVPPVAQPAPLAASVDLPGAAKVCADMARVLDAGDLPGLLLRLADVLGAPGLIVWVADRSGQVLMPLLTHGYPASAVARIGSLATSAENATALAWRTGEIQVVPGSGQESGALVAPIVTADGCVGALAAELPAGSEGRTDVRALATIFAAQLATFVTALPSVGGQELAATN
jgi:hypothetical protein